MAVESIFISARTSATSKRMNDIWLTGGTHLALVMLDAELPGFAYKFNIFSGTIGLNLAEKSLDTAIDSSLVEDWTGGCRRRCRLGGGAGELCRCGLPDCRHTSL